VSGEARILGIDPGLSGGLALLHGGAIIQAAAMPVVKVAGKGEIDLARLGAILRDWAPSHAWVEQQQSMPRQGVASSFRTGQNYGTLLGFLQASGVPVAVVRPAVWKRAMGVPSDKAAAVAIASRLLPSSSHWWPRRGDDGIAEAALLAVYGSRQGG
jgi:crossover junction endodeoxyribonuclease RuvC